MYHILDKAWRIYYKNIIVHIFFSILFLALPYAMYLLSKAQVGYVTSAAVIFLLSVAEVFFGFFPFYVSVAKERITLLWKKLLRPAALLSLWWAPLVTALYIAMQFCIREEIMPTVVVFPVFGGGFSILFFITCIISTRVTISLMHNGEKSACTIGKKVIWILVAAFALLPFVLAFLHDAVIRAYSNPVIPPELATALAVLFSSSYLPIVFYVVCWGEKSRDLNL